MYFDVDECDIRQILKKNRYYLVRYGTGTVIESSGDKAQNDTSTYSTVRYLVFGT